ncbi:MAG: glycosyltransferase family 39 protein [Gemmatimonadetes bacterium]|nr:glycosyltransferase family 39 protein [Gemmatimonadota bacterium]
MPSSPVTSNVDELLRRPVVLILLWAGAVAVVALAAGHFWIPLDDGTLAQSAERVLHGQLPQRDFGDPYSGLNAILGALALHFFGDRLSSLRVPLVVGFALWLPGLWLVARRFLSTAAATAATVLAAILSVPTYPAAMPTWFTLYLITWGLWCLLGFLEPGSPGHPSMVGSRWWLASAGVLAGLSILFKVVGLYFVAAALLALAARRSDGSRSYVVVTLVGVAAFLALLGRLVLPGTTPTGIWHFFLPAAALCGAVVWTTWRGVPNRAAAASTPRQNGAVSDEPIGPGSKAGDGVFHLLADGLFFLAGAVLPVAVFLIPYLASGSVDAWFRGVFLLPTRRLQSAASPLGSLTTALPGAVAVGLLWLDTRLRGVMGRRMALGLAALLAVALGLDDALGGVVMESLWYALRGWIPALVIWGAVAWARRDASGEGGIGPGALAVVATAALWLLVEFPYASPAYFFYVAPVGVLATTALVGGPNHRPGPVLALLAAVAAFLGAGYGVGVAAAGDTPLDLPRGGIRVSSTDARTYERLSTVVRDHIDGGSLWAGPDAPEVYYLTGEPNPTPTLYEFLDPGSSRGVGHLDTLFVSHDVRVVVVNRRPLFSAPLDSSAVTWLYRTFPAGDTVGSFSVRWKETP